MAKRKKKPGHRPPIFKAASTKKKDAAAGAYNELRQLPTSALVSTINTMVEILSDRGVAIRDWDEKDKAVQKVRMIGGKAYILAPREKSHSEEPTHDEDGECDSGG